MNNLAEKVNECPVVKYCLCKIGQRTLSVIRCSGVSAIQGLLKY